MCIRDRYGFGKTTKRLRKGVEAANNAGVEDVYKRQYSAWLRYSPIWGRQDSVLSQGMMPLHVQPAICRACLLYTSRCV